MVMDTNYELYHIPENQKHLMIISMRDFIITIM